MQISSLLKLMTIFLLVACGTVQQQETSRPNIVLIMADDIGISDIGCYGSEIARLFYFRLG